MDLTPAKASVMRDGAEVEVPTAQVLAQIVKLVREAQNSKAPAQPLADKAAQWLVVAAIVIGLSTFA